jgi:hypothetical protein
VATCRQRHFRYERAAQKLPARYWVTSRPILVQVIEHDPLRRGLWDTLRAGIQLRHDASGVVRQPVANGHGTQAVERFAVLNGELAGSCVEWLVPGSADPSGWIARADASGGVASAAM